MTAVRAVYDGEVFIPEKPCEIERGTKVTLTIEAANHGLSVSAIAALRGTLHQIDTSDLREDDRSL